MPIENATDETEDEVVDTAMEAPDDAETKDQAQAEDDSDEDVDVVTIGGEAAPASDENAPNWVRDLRKRARELERENADLRKGVKPQTIEVGDKPTIAGCDYDDEVFTREFDAWTARKAAADRVRTEAETAQTKAQEAWNTELATYGTQKQSLKVPDFAEAEEEVTSILSPAQQAIMISGAENKALLIYAIGRNPERLAALAAITDPVKFAFAAARLEKDLKVEKRRASTSPESVVKGSAPLTGASDAKLQRLEAEAAKTGDRSKIIAYRKSLKKA